MQHTPFGQTMPQIPSSSLLFIFSGDRLLVHQQEGALVLPTVLPPAYVDLVGYARLLPGSVTPAVAIDLLQGGEPAAGEFVSLRSLFHHLQDDLWSLAGTASQIVRWNRDHQFCSRCGATVSESSRELAKQCSRCGLTSYPRITPAVIMTISDGDRLLLARNRRFPPGKYSPLAGFVEPGETMEQAVGREVMEEVNLQVDNITYFGSQSWPFPHSLMVAFTTRFKGGTLQVDNQEITDARWFTRDQLPPILPPRVSIAYQLVTHFLHR